MCARIASVLVAGLVMVGVTASAQEKKDDKKPTRPPLDAKEWKKQPSGLEIWDVTEGAGNAVKAGETLKLHYAGWLTDEKATEFVNTRGGEPKQFDGLQHVMKGWQEGIVGMKRGGVRRLKIPPELAYGKQGGKIVPPNAVVVFEIEVVTTPAAELIGKFPDLKSKEWKKLPSGLEVWDLKQGEGDAVQAGGTVKVHYIGWLTDGTVIDSSRKREQPAEFSLGSVIKGWQEGVPGMKPGGVRRLKIPPELAYGPRATGQIPANSVLVFEIELVK